ncbi:unnamed protein product, partial [Allacma fusca]
MEEAQVMSVSSSLTHAHSQELKSI